MAIETYGVAFSLCVSLVDRANRPQFKAAPTIAAGDFKVSTAGGALTNLATLPNVYPAGSKSVRIQLSAGEMTGETVTVIGSDAAGAEWDDILISITPEPVERVANATKIGGTTQTGRDIGASVLISSGTGTGQISLSSGAVLLQATQTGVTIPTVTNLTNAPTAGDLTATMKTSVTTAATAATPTVAAVTGAVGSVTGNVGGNVTGSVGSISTVRPKKNTGLDNFMFPMFDATTKNPKTGLTVTAERAIDGNPFAPCSNSAVELSNGVYRVSLSASDLNGNKVMLRFSAPGADDQLVEIITQD